MPVWATDSHGHLNEYYYKNENIEACENLIAHNLGCQHCERFALSGIDFARHDWRTRLVLWQRKFTQAASWARTEETNVVRYLHKWCCNNIQCAMNLQLLHLINSANLSTSTRASWEANASNLFGAVTKGNPVSSEILLQYLRTIISP